MYKPTVILTGKNAGLWYILTLEEMKKNKASFDYNTLQVDFESINALLPYKMKEAAKLLEPYFAKLELQRQPYILANITLHEAVQYFSFVPEYFISIADILKEEAKQELGKVAILGTKFTMNHSYITSLLPEVALVPLSKKLQEQVENLRKVYFHTPNKLLAKEVFEQLKKMKIDYFVIACTELILGFQESKIELKLLSLPKLQVQSLSKQ